MDELQGASRTRERLVSVVSHELRTPLTAILGFAEILYRNGPRFSEQARKEHARTIMESAQQLRETIENMNFSGEVVGTDALDRAELSTVIAPLVKRVALAGERVIDLQIREPGFVRVQPPILRSIVTNLLSNAEKYSPPGSNLRLDIGREGPCYVLEVSNHMDELIDDDDLAFLGEAFTQQDDSRERAHGGMGLGLYVVRRLVETHGGRVSTTITGRRMAVAVHLPSAARIGPATGDLRQLPHPVRKLSGRVGRLAGQRSSAHDETDDEAH